MEKLIYKITKNIPGFTYKPNTEFHVINNEVYVREYSFSRYLPMKRNEEFDKFNFDAFVDMGMMTREATDLPNCEWKEGDLVVYNRYGLEYFNSNFSINPKKTKNEVCSVISTPILEGKNIVYVTIKNVMDGREHKVKMTQLLAPSKKYWFIDSHGNIKMTYFWLNPLEDRYRIANKNVFVSHDASLRARENIYKKEMKNIEELKEFVMSWKS